MKNQIKRLFIATGIIMCLGLGGCKSDASSRSTTAKRADTKNQQSATEKQKDGEGDTLHTTQPEQDSEQPKASEEASPSEESAQQPTEQPSEEPSEEPIEQPAQLTGMEAGLLGDHYAGEILGPEDFYVLITNEDGSQLTNPLYWTALPLELVEGENVITVAYEDVSTVVTVNVGIRPENVNPAEPVQIVEQNIFAMDGPSILTETADMGQEYIDKMIFLGDSRTYSYQAYGILSGGKNTTQVWTPRSHTMTLSAQGYATICYPETGEDMTIRDAVAAKRPEYMVIGLGTNGVSYMNEDSFKAEFRSLVNDIRAISPETKVILNSIYPVTNFYPHLNQINNDKIASCNRWMMEVAQETGAKYLNTAEALVTADGWLNPAYENGGDGMHLNKPGNEIVMNYIRTHGYQ